MAAASDRRTGIVIDLFRAATLFSRLGGKLASTVGLASVQQWIILGTVAQHDGCSLTTLRTETLVTKQNISTMVERLIQSGYLHSYTDNQDRRITRLTLTSHGREVLNAIAPLYRDSNAESFAGFTAKDVTDFSGLLQRLVTRLIEQAER